MPGRKKTEEVEVVAFKGFDKDLRCRGYQYEFGKTHEHVGRVVACQSGFHACENPADVLSYYGFVGDDGSSNRFARVTLSGEIARHHEDSKVVGGKITLDAEVKLPEFVGLVVKWIIDATTGKGDDPGGHYAQIGSSGNSAQIGSSGDSARIGSSGDSAQIGSSGNYARIGSSGNYAQIGSSGNSAQIGSSGDSARIGSSGHYARINSTGADAVVACAGPGAVVTTGPGGAICIPWHDGKRTRFAVGYVGEDGIEEGVTYRAQNGKLVRA